MASQGPQPLDSPHPTAIGGLLGAVPVVWLHRALVRAAVRRRDAVSATEALQ